MDTRSLVISTAHDLYTRSGGTKDEKAERPPVYKVIGLSLAIASGVFIGSSFVLKKTGLLKANVKYKEEAGEGYGYLKNAFWWSGMSLMIVGEICNFAAYMFADAILVTPLGALSVVICTILSAIFLKERLSFVGKVGCFMCIIGSVVIALNAPEQSAVANIQDMQHFVIAPGFLSYTGVIILGCLFIALWVGPRYGKKSMLVYLSICSLIGGLSVVATQGFGAAITAQIRGPEPQFKNWFIYVLLAFVVTTLITEIIFLNVSGLTIQTNPPLADPLAESAQHLQRGFSDTYLLRLFHQLYHRHIGRPLSWFRWLRQGYHHHGTGLLADLRWCRASATLQIVQRRSRCRSLQRRFGSGPNSG